MFVTGWLILVLAAASLTSCAEPSRSERSFTVVFVVESDPGIRLESAQVSVDGKPIGETDSHGRVHTDIRAHPHQQVRVEHECPDGYKDPSEPKILRLRQFEDINSSSTLHMEVTLRCPPEKRLAVFIVRVNEGSSLPVLLNGENIARTNTSGVAHFSAWGPPGTEYVIELDTTEHPRLVPQFPRHLFTVPDAEEVFVVDQSFDTKRGRPPAGHQRSRITKIE